MLCDNSEHFGRDIILPTCKGGTSVNKVVVYLSNGKVLYNVGLCADCTARLVRSAMEVGMRITVNGEQSREEPQ